MFALFAVAALLLGGAVAVIRHGLRRNRAWRGPEATYLTRRERQWRDD